MKHKLQQVARTVITQARQAKAAGVKTGTKVVAGAKTFGKKTTTIAGNVIVGTAVSEGFNYVLSHEKTATAKAAISEQVPVAVVALAKSAHAELHESAQAVSAAIVEKAPTAARVVTEATSSRVITNSTTQLLNRFLVNPAVVVVGTLFTAAVCVAAYMTTEEGEKVIHEAAATVAAELTSDPISNSVEAKVARAVGTKAALVAGAVTAHAASAATKEAYECAKNAITISM